MDVNRRAFLTGLLAAAAVVKLPPVKPEVFAAVDLAVPGADYSIIMWHDDSFHVRLLDELREFRAPPDDFVEPLKGGIGRYLGITFIEGGGRWPHNSRARACQ
jgi:hypothetical protein